MKAIEASAIDKFFRGHDETRANEPPLVAKDGASDGLPHRFCCCSGPGGGPDSLAAGNLDEMKIAKPTGCLLKSAASLHPVGLASIVAACELAHPTVEISRDETDVQVHFFKFYCFGYTLVILFLLCSPRLH